MCRKITYDISIFFTSCSAQQQELESIMQEGKTAKFPLPTESSAPCVLLDWVQHWSQESRQLILLEAGAKG